MMIEMAKRSIPCMLLAALAMGPLAGGLDAQEGVEATPDIENVLLTFRLVEANGFSDDDPEISDVVAELRKLFNFEGYRLLSTSVFNVGLLPATRTANALEGTGSQRIFPSGSDAPLTLSAVLATRRATRSVRATVILTDATVRTVGATVTERLPLLEASATFRDGQTMVLGTPRRGADEPVLILIVTPRIDPIL